MLSVVFAVSTASADSKTIDCAEAALLTAANAAPKASELDYAISDLEGLFFTFLDHLQRSDEIEPARVEFFLKDALNLKAQVLNRALAILPPLMRARIDNARKTQLANSVYIMIDTLGVSPGSYGLELDDDRNVKVPDMTDLPPAEESHSLPIAKSQIGFVFVEGPDSELPDHVHRSIGYGPLTLNVDLLPARQAGFIHRAMKEEGQLIIVDGEQRLGYQFPIQLLSFHTFQGDGKIYRLGFNQQIFNWVVTVENTNNPEGRIGF